MLPTVSGVMTMSPPTSVEVIVLPLILILSTCNSARFISSSVALREAFVLCTQYTPSLRKILLAGAAIGNKEISSCNCKNVIGLVPITKGPCEVS